MPLLAEIAPHSGCWDLRGADLRGAKLFGAKLNGVVYDAATRWPEGFDPSIQGGVFDTPNRGLVGVDLRRRPPGYVQLEARDLRGARLTGAILNGAILRQARLRSADLSAANLEAALLIYTNFQGARLRGAYLKGASLRDADFHGADLAGAQLKDAIYDRNTRWPEGFDPVRAGALIDRVTRRQLGLKRDPAGVAGPPSIRSRGS